MEKDFSVLLTPHPRPTDKTGATIVLKNEFTLQERSLHFYLHLNLSGMFLRRHSVCGMLILSLTGNRIRYTPIRSRYAHAHRLYYYTHIYTKSKRILLFFALFCKDFFERSMMFFSCEQAQNVLPMRRPSDDFNDKHPYTRPYQVCVYRQKLITEEEKHRLCNTKHRNT